jgi:hypothetical protein
MASDFRNVRERILARFPIMRSSVFERRMLFTRSSQRKTPPRPVHVSAPRAIVPSFERPSIVPEA